MGIQYLAAVAKGQCEGKWTPRRLLYIYIYTYLDLCGERGRPMRNCLKKQHQVSPKGGTTKAKATKGKKAGKAKAKGIKVRAGFLVVRSLPI